MNIYESAKILKLSYVMNNYKEFITEAQKLDKDYENFLEELFKRELENRRENGVTRMKNKK